MYNYLFPNTGPHELPMTETRILIVEDEPLIAESIAMHLANTGFAISGIAYDSDEALNELQVNSPDAAILDINLESSKDGIEIAEYINQHLQIPFIYLTSYSDNSIMQRAKATSPAGYIVKPFNKKTLVATLEIAISNHAQLSNRHVPRLNFDKINQCTPSPLSQREFEVVQLLYEGKSNQQTADQLFISLNTLKRHINNAYFKLDVNSRTSAIAKLREAMLK
jgi:DNA-binding NarL/FixJ family response regulator